jgi:endonuclease/exonuclease/phosphatase (EEP) superfamily protein YafD
VAKRKRKSPAETETVQTSPGERQGIRRGQALAVALSAALCITLTIYYLFRPDLCAAVTVFPVWFWLFPGLLLLAVGYHRAHRRWFAAALCLWLFYLTLLAEEPKSLIRSLGPVSSDWEAARQRGEGMRVVSLNCAGGSPEAALEIAAYNPDIVLLQESPPRKEVEEIGRRLFGEQAATLWGLDASIVARGSLEPRALPRALQSYCAQARLRLPNGFQTEVFSLRLQPVPFRADLWNPDCWRTMMRDRRQRRLQLQAVVHRIAATPAPVPVILGGDFNAPQGDAIFQSLRPRLRDAFSAAGRGWGNTITADYPVLRIDQIWVSDRFHPVSVVARRLQNSDHRLVICDLLPVSSSSTR